MTGDDKQDRFSVAIVGAGMGGATAAYYLRQLYGSQCAITLFEQSGRIGGRMRATTFGGRLFETGASIFHSSNHYMLSFARKFNLRIEDDGGDDDRFVFYDGFGKCAFNTLGGPRVFTQFRLIWHYGFDLLRIGAYTKSLIKDFTRIYKLQDDGQCFTTTAQLLNAMRPEFVEMTSHSYRSWLVERVKVGKELLNELSYGLISNNYCQDQDVHAFVGFISMSTVGSKLLAVKDGNELVPVNLIKEALSQNPPGASTDIVHAQVTGVEPLNSQQKYALEYVVNDREQRKQRVREEFDYVILATPLHQESTIEGKNGLTLPKSVYRRVDHSFLRGTLKDIEFGITSGSYGGDQNVIILPTQHGYLKDQSCLFRSMISPKMQEGTTSSRVWITFSEPQRVPDPIRSLAERYFQPLTAGVKNGLLEDSLLVKWLAYPVYKPLKNPQHDLGQFVVAPRLYYANAIEQAASCMEMAAIGGRNAALLIAADRQKTSQRTFSEIDRGK